MMIIKIAQEQAGFHVIESQSNRTENWMGDDWVEVPKNLEPSVLETLGWCDLQIEDGVLVGITPTESPELEPVQTVPTSEDRLSALESAMLSMMGVTPNV